MSNWNIWLYAVLSLGFHWLGLYLITRHRRGVPSWWVGIASAGFGGYVLTLALRLSARTLSLALLLARWAALPIVVALTAAYALALGIRSPHRPVPRRPLLISAILGGIVCLLIIPLPYLFRPPTRTEIALVFHAGPLYPLWSAYVLGMIGAALYQLARSVLEQSSGPAKSGAWRRFTAILLIAMGGIWDNLVAYAKIPDWPQISRAAYASGLLLMAYWVGSDPAFLPRLRALYPCLIRSATGVFGAVLGTMTALWLGYRMEGASPPPTALILSAYWMITVVMLWPRWEKRSPHPRDRGESTLRHQLGAFLRRREEPSLGEQLDSLVTALAYALDTDEVCLVQVTGEEVRFLAHYNAFRVSSPLTEIMVSYPDPARWPERMAAESGMAVSVPGPDALWLLVDMPSLETDYGPEERALAEEVAARIGRLWTASFNRSQKVPERGSGAESALLSLLQSASSRRMLGQALRYLYDPAALGRTALGRLGPGRTAWERGEATRDWLLRGIKALRPTGGREGSIAWRRYEAIRLRYVEGLSVQEVSERLHISRRQCQRELRGALESLRDWLLYTHH